MRFADLAARARLRGHLLARAFRLVWASAPGWTTASLVLVAAQGLLPLATLYLIKLLVDALAAAFHGIVSPVSGAGAGAGVVGAAGTVAGAAGAPAHAGPVLLILAAAGAVAVLEVVARSLGAYVAEAQTETVTDHLSDVIHEKSAALDLSYFEDPHYTTCSTGRRRRLAGAPPTW